MSTQEIASTNNLQMLSTNYEQSQYTFWQILGVWALVALPMGLILWVVMPTLIPHVDMNPGFLYFILITWGQVWQGVVAYMILRREVKPFTWEGLKARYAINIVRKGEMK